MIGDSEHFDIQVGDGLRLHVTRSGTGPPVVLLHGFTGSGETWGSLRATLDEHFATIAVDLPGHGRSNAPAKESRFALSRFADDLCAVLDALGITRAAVVGYSMGGRAALHFASRHPDRVAALVLECTSPGISDALERTERVAADRALAQQIDTEGVAAFVDRWERLPLWASQVSLPTAVRAELRAQRLANSRAGLSNSLRGAGAGVEPPVLDQLAGHLTPTLVISGALDAKYIALAQQIASVMPGARTAIIADSGHAVHLEQPAEFNNIIKQFLDTVASEKGQWR